MTLSSGLRRLADVVDQLERADIEVRDAALDPDAAGDCVTATVELSIAVEPAVTGTDITVDGTLDEPVTRDTDDESGEETGSNSDEAATPAGAAGSDTSVQPSSDSPDRDGVPCPEPDCTATFESEPGMKVHRTKVHRSGGDADGDGTPSYRDPERLASAYEAEDTFPAMRDALDADVSAQTVRRHMIRHGIHDPEDEDGTGGDGAGDAGEDTPAALTDGAALADLVPSELSLPADLELGNLRDCVESADTLYDVQQRFDLDRETARDLLAAFDLLELVHGRVATKHERDRLKNEIDRRIRTTLSDTPAA